jgi:Flp pilus assembly CpaF family ATPase
MTAMSGGGRPAGIPNPLSSASERPHADESRQRDESHARDESRQRDDSRPRALDQIFPMEGDANRSREMQAAWRSFCRDRLEAVRGVLGAGRSPPEIAYQLGELLHNHFRTRGVTLTSYELRRLVAELLSLHGPGDERHEPVERPAPEPPPTLPSPPVPTTQALTTQAPTPPPVATTPEPPPEPEGPPKPEAPKKEPPIVVRPRTAAPPAVVPVVAFEREPKQPWPGDVPLAPPAAVADKALEPPPSPIVKVVPREAAPFERLLSRAIDLAKGRPAVPGRQAAIAAVEAAVAAPSEPPEKPAAPPEKPPPPPPPLPERPAAAVPSEGLKLGLIDRLWSDRSIQAIYVNGPQSVFVERGGTLHAVKEAFRDEAHLSELVGRLVGQPEGGMADFQLRDGTTGFVILPPLAPSGPVLTMRRADPGQATLDRLVAGGALDRPVAELLRLGARGRLNMLVTGPPGCGKTALLVALVRDLEPSMHVVTVASHRHFAWPMTSKVELVAVPPVSIAKLVPPAAKLAPGLLVLDGVALEDVAALAERLLRGAPGTLAAVGPEAMSDALARSVDLVAHIDRLDGAFRVVTVEDSAGAMVFRHEDGKLVRGTTTPAFAPSLQARGQGAALGKLLA